MKLEVRVTNGAARTFCEGCSVAETNLCGLELFGGVVREMS